MNELLLGATIAAVIGAVAGWWAVTHAARRAVHQPLETAVGDEVTLLLGVLSNLRRLPYLTTIEAKDFAVGAHQRIWTALVHAASAELATLPAEPTDDDCGDVGDALLERADEIHAQLQALLAGSPTGYADLGLLAQMSAMSAERDVTDEEVVLAGEVVWLVGSDRQRFAGQGRVGPSRTPDSTDPASPPIQRFPTPPSVMRRLTGAALAAVAFAVAPFLAESVGLTGVSLWLGVAALATLATGSLVMSLVDLETMFIDLRTLVWTSAGGWLLAAAAVGVDGRWSSLAVGGVVVAATAVVFEAGNRLYRWRNGIDGQGFGDTMLVVATVGVPAALSGDWLVGYYGVFAAFGLAAAGWLIGFVLRRAHKDQPFAMGPYLAGGWLVGWLAFNLLELS